MTLGHKTLKPLRFLSLSLAFGLGGMLFALPAHGKAEKIINKERCVEEFSKKLKGFSRTDPSKKEALCAASNGAENDKIGELAESRQKLKLSSGNEESTGAEGACQASYESTILVLDRLIASRRKVCEQFDSEINGKLSTCLGEKPPEECKSNLREMENTYDQGKKKLIEDIEKSIAFLKKHSGWSKNARNKFESDLRQLKAARAGNERLDGPTLNEIHSTVQGSESLEKYLEKLEKNASYTSHPRISGGTILEVSPIREQKEAEKFVGDLVAELNKLKANDPDDYQYKLKGYRESMERKTGSIGGNESTLGNVAKYGGAAAPLAGALLQNNNGTTSSIAAGSSGALPALAMMGAAGAAGIAMGQKSGSSAGLGSSVGQVDGPVMTPNNDKAAGTEFGGSEANQATATPSPNPESPTGTNNESKGSGNAVEASNGALAAALGGGASLMPGADKSKPKRDVASTAAGATGGEEALSSFTGSLRPSPRPSSSSDSAGNDVSNLLGRMKDLFKMDDTFGGDMPPDTYAGGPANGAPMSGPSGGDEYTGEESSEGEEYQAGGEYGDEGSEETYQGASPMGDIEVTLFRRVHARHVKCMEKGLVLLLSQELPE